MNPWPKNPVIDEINAWAWLQEWSQKCKSPVTLACIALVLLGILIGPFSSAQVAKPEEPDTSSLPEGLSLNLNTSFFSQYIWRGQELSQDSLVMFPSLGRIRAEQVRPLVSCRSS